MGKPTICIGEYKDADQLRGNREADQRLYFRYTDSTFPLLSKSKRISEDFFSEIAQEVFKISSSRHLNEVYYFLLYLAM